LERIPEHEYNNLSRKILTTLQTLAKNGKYSTDDLEISERRKHYEEFSNPVSGFVTKEYTRDVLGEVNYLLFLKDFMEWHRQRGGKMLTETTIKKMITACGLSHDRHSIRTDEGFDKVNIIRGITAK